MIIQQLETGAEKVFCYLLICPRSNKAVVIDPGGGEEEILARLEKTVTRLLYIINTHSHPDHTCGNSILKNATGAAIVMHVDDAVFLQDSEAVEYFKRFKLRPTPPPDILVRHGDIISYGECELRVIHTPGHTPGSICLYGDGNLFTGDSVFVGAAGRVDLPGGDFNTLITSLEANIAILPDETVIWPGHDYGDTVTSTVGREKKENPFLGGEW